MKSKAIQRQLRERHGGATDAQMLAAVCRSANGLSKFARAATSHDEFVIARIQERVDEVEAERPRAVFPVWDSRAFTPGLYGISEWGYLHTSRQILALSTFARLVGKLETAAMSLDPELRGGVRLLLGLALGRLTDTMASTCRWVVGTPERGGSFIAGANGGEKHMRWLADFAEANPLSGETGSWNNQLNWVVRVIKNLA
ncbi:MAG: hypothetical protein ACREX4_06285 [Gammaproteobacteria bacterium]